MMYILCWGGVREGWYTLCISSHCMCSMLPVLLTGLWLLWSQCSMSADTTMQTARYRQLCGAVLYQYQVHDVNQAAACLSK